MRIINCCGYGNTGCTAQTDFLYDHKGVVGALKPFHELGFLKCRFSFGGMMLSVIQKWDHNPTKEEVRRSLCGEQPDPNNPIEGGAKAHLELRALLKKQYGKVYQSIVDDAVNVIPDAYHKLPVRKLVPIFREAVGTFVRGLIVNIQPGHFFDGEYDPETSVIGFKNDPPGAFPIFSTFLLGGQTSAIIRDPRDTTYDFNRHYNLGHTMETVKRHCAHYNAQLNSARSQIEKFGRVIQPFYKVIEFERLIQEQDYRDAYRNIMIGEREQVRFRFDPEKSAVNIKHWHNMDKEFVDYVEETCMDNYLTYKEFLVKRDMMLVV